MKQTGQFTPDDPRRHVGRARGSKNKATVQREQEAADRLLLRMIAENEDMPMSVRARAAEKLFGLDD